MSRRTRNPDGDVPGEEYTRDPQDGDSPPAPPPEEGARAAGNRLARQDAPAARSTGPNAVTGAYPGDSGDDSLPPGEALKVEEFKFLECDPQIPGEESDPCAICHPNPYAYVPDYRAMSDGEVFFDGKVCTQNIIITVPSPTREGPLPAEIDASNKQYREDGIRLLLDYFNKSEVMTAYSYRPLKELKKSGMAGFDKFSILPPLGAATPAWPVGASGAMLETGEFDAFVPPPIPGYTLKSEEINTIKELLQYTTYKFYVPIQKKGRTRILISVPVEQFNRVPEILLSEPDTEFETNLQVTFRGRDFLPILGRVERAFKVYDGALRRWRTFDGGSLIEAADKRQDAYYDILSGTTKTKPARLDLFEEAGNIKLFGDHIKTLVEEEAGLSFSPMKPAKNIEFITFKFREEGPKKIRLQQIIFNKPGCEDIKVTENGRYKGIFNKLVKKMPFKRSRTLHYIGAAPEIDLDLQAREPTPWLQVVTSYTYPPIEVFFGQNTNTAYSDPTLLQCLGKGPINETVDEFMNEFEDLLLGFPDAVLEEFSKSSCHTREELKEELSDLGAAFGKDGKLKKELKRVTEEAKRSIKLDNPYLNIVFEEMFPGEASFNAMSTESPRFGGGGMDGIDYKDMGEKKGYRSFLKSKEYKFMTRLNDRLGWCGWVALILQAADCVAAGLGEDGTTQALAKAAFGAMDDNYLGRTFLGLSPEDQRNVVNAVENQFGSMPAPWDDDFKPGNNTYPPQATFKDTAGGQNRKQVRTDAENEARAARGNIPPGSEDAVEDAIAQAGDDAVQEVLDDNAYALAHNQAFENPGSGGAGGTYGTALGAVQKAVFKAYKDAMLDVVGADTLLEQMNRLPGAPIVAGIFKHLPCKITPPFYTVPRIDDFAKSLESEVCQWNMHATAPVMHTKIIEFKDIFMQIINGIKEAIEELAVALLMAAIKLILEKILSLACDLIGSAGATLMDLFAGNDHFRDLLKDNMCPDATESDLYDSLRDIFGTVGGPDATCLEQLSNAVLGEFLDDLSIMLTQEQILELLNGNISAETMQLALEVAATSDSECIQEIFSDPNAFITFFPGLSVFIPNLPELNEALKERNGNTPVYPCPPDILDNIDDLKCKLLAQKGLSPKECREQLDDIKDKAIQDYSDLINNLQNGPLADMPGIESPPGCAPGILATENPMVSAAAQSVTKILFETIENAYLKDMWGVLMFGKGGMLNAILSDTKGRPFKRHNWLVKNFGSPLAIDLTDIEFHSDNAIQTKEGQGPDKIPIDIYGQELTGDDGGKRAFMGYSNGGFPPTVGAHLAKQYGELKPEFKSVNSPDSARDQYEKVVRKNKDKIKKRKKYIEAFIDQFNLENRKTSFKEKFRAAANDLREGASMELFVPDDPKKDPGFANHSPGQRTRNVLRGKNISIAGELVGTQPPGRWDDKPKKKAGVGDSKSFVDHYEDGEWYRLRPLPDTSSADIRLKYKGYNDDPRKKADPDYAGYEVDIQYDYNLFDHDTGKISQNFEYGLKVVETHRSYKGGKLTNPEKKELGMDIPPASILGDEEFIFTKYDLKVKSTSDEGVLDIIDSLDITDDISDSYEIEILSRYFASIFIDKSSAPNETFRKTSDPKFRKYFAVGPPGDDGEGHDPSTYDQIASGFFQKISTLISSGKLSTSGKNKGPDESELNKKESQNAEDIGLDGISKGFLFGYDPYKEPKIIELDPMEYGGPLGRMFPESTPPPFYVQERKQKGWMDMANALVPEVDGCEPSRKPIFQLGDLEGMVTDLTNSLVKDERLNYDPSCSTEAPFDRIMTSYDAANIEAVIRAIVRIYTLDVFIRGVPVFATIGLTKDNYDSLLESFIAERIRQGLYEDGKRRTGKTDDEYYYRVLEQAVNNTVRMIDSGLINPAEDFDADEQEALDTIIKSVKRFYKDFNGKLEELSTTAIKTQDIMKRAFSSSANAPLAGLGAGSTKFSKAAAKLAKSEAFIFTVRDVEKEASVFLRRYIREEFDKITAVFSNTLPPLVNNIHHTFLINDQWIRGSVYGGGPFDVVADPTISSEYNIEPMSTEMPVLPFFKSDSVVSYWPFVLEKYIKIEEKKTPRSPREVRKRNENLYNIVNINEWDHYVKTLKKEGVEGNISDFWGTPLQTGGTTKIEDHEHTYEFDSKGNGKTSTHIHVDGSEHYHKIENYVIVRANLNPDDDGHRHELPSEGWKFGLRICYMPEDEDRDLFKDIISDIDSETCMNEKAFRISGPSEEKYVIPIASAELPIADQKYTLFDPDKYDVYCLIEELVKTPEYKLMFKTLFPLQRYTSALATYCVMAFFDSIGNSSMPAEGGDLWMVPGGKIGKKFRKWDRAPSQTMKKSRQAARMVFTSFYEGTQAIDFDTSNDKTDPLSGPTKFREMIRPKVNFEDGLRWWQRGRRIMTRPYNKDGDEC